MVISERVALTRKLSKIKLRFLKRFTKLAIIGFIFFSLTGYYPTLSIPPVKKSLALASYKAAGQEQKEEVIAESFSKPLVLPHPGYLTTRFSTWHPGIDIATGLGMPVRPIINGKVFEVGRDFWGLGNYVVVTHENGFKSKYAHMGKIYVKVKDEVAPENILGEVGLTGHTSGPHTHLEITRNDSYVNPQALLPEIPDMPRPIAQD
ncbi:MAG: M23 family metallopeptidase [Candidatus Daviesbacteria bacterium]|nr:M23 family metallopeptidase [Candidatus Daviesbacteria bacterium]